MNSQKKFKLPNDAELARRLRIADNRPEIVKNLHPLIVEELKAGEGVLSSAVIILHLASAFERYAPDNTLSMIRTKSEWMDRYLKALITDREILSQALGHSDQGRRARR
ncbi:MAG: hypothetical protein JWP06_496 [Candidatus Saccharibacteria bacterium]|nr:hypothetical protein [Candidatus Saccharibacteria bacterium]